jgi:hypothetical protein
MPPDLPVSPGALVDTARAVVAKIRPGATEGRRSLPIRAEPEEIERLWADADRRRAVLGDLPVADAALDFGPEADAWGRTVTLRLRLESAVPGTATQALAGKAIRRLKALAETGEVPTTARNPSARADAGEFDA